MQMGRRSHQPCSCSVLRGSCPCEPRVDLRRREAMHRRSARARRIYACSSSCRKQPHRSAIAVRLQPCRWVAGRINHAHARSCEEAVLASLTWICDAEQLYTDVALVLDAFTRVAAAARSCLIVASSMCTCIASSTLQMGRINRSHMFGVARKLILRASGGSVTLSSYTQAQRSC